MSAPPAGLASALNITPLGARLAAIIGRWAFDGIDGPVMAAARVLADPQIAADRGAAATLAVLRQRHQPRPWGRGSDTVVCSCGSGAFDACEDARLLHPDPCC